MPNMIYSDEMAVSVSAALTYADMSGSPYSPLKNGRLRKVILVIGGDAVTSLIEMVVVRLTCPDWGVPITVATSGNNLRTAPTTPIRSAEQVCDVPVTQSSKITIQVKNETAATPVTPRYSLIGVFEG